MRDVLRDNSVPSSDLCAGEGAAQSKDTAGRKVKGVDSVDSEAGWREGERLKVERLPVYAALDRGWLGW